MTYYSTFNLQNRVFYSFIIAHFLLMLVTALGDIIFPIIAGIRNVES